MAESQSFPQILWISFYLVLLTHTLNTKVALYSSKIFAAHPKMVHN